MPAQNNPLRYGLKFSQQVHPIDVQVDVWRTADAAGFDHIWPFDHLIALGPDPTALIFDGWTVLGAMAAKGLLIQPPPIRAHSAPGEFDASRAKGRLAFVLGDQRPHPADSAADEPRATYKGRFYELKDAIAEPKPVQRPHPPIWIGSKGERMLRLTARHADVWHSNAATFEEGVALSKALDAVCTKAGRDPASVRRSISMRLTTREETLQKAKATIAAGFTEILMMIGGGNMPAGDPRKRAEEAAALLPRLRALG